MQRGEKALMILNLAFKSGCFSSDGAASMAVKGLILHCVHINRHCMCINMHCACINMQCVCVSVCVCSGGER